MRLRLGLFLALAITVESAQPEWTIGRLDIPGVGSVNGMAFGNGRWVIQTTGESGPRISWSTDGRTWHGSVPLRYSGLIFVQEHFYLAALGIIYRSPDGVSWETVDVAVPGTYSIAASDGTGLLLQSGTTANDGRFVISGDLVAWQQTAPLPNAGEPGRRLSVLNAAYGAGRYFVNYVSTGTGPLDVRAASTVDGTRWTPVPELAYMQGIAGGNGRLVGMFEDRAWITTDGTTFSVARIPAEVASPAKLHFAGGRFFTARSLHSSVDGVNWTALPAPPKTISSAFFAVAYGNGKYLAGGMDVPPPGATRSVEVFASLETPAPPIIARQPRSLFVVEGHRAVLTAMIEDPDANTTIQWRRNGDALPGATSASYAAAAATAADAGRYIAEIRNPIGTAFTDPADLTVVSPADAGRIINFSVLTTLDAPDAVLTCGFVVGGGTTGGGPPLLVRAAGPSLAQFGIGGPHAGPRLELFGPGGKLGENEQWGGSTAVASASVRVGAFPFGSPNSRDVAMLVPSVSGEMTSRISANGSTGAVIVEVYDARSDGLHLPSTPRLVNVSVLKPIAAEGAISAGFVIAGRTPKALLIRAVGPGLAAFGVDAPLAAPGLKLYRAGGDAPTAVSTGWRSDTKQVDATRRAGAFALEADSRDAALLLMLPAGNYVAEAEGDSHGGAVLLEVYEVP